MKKYMIRCDMEGASGVVSYTQSVPGRPEYESGKKLFMEDLLALINGLNDGGANEIYIYDEHYYGRNVDISLLPDNVTVCCGKPPYREEWAGGIDESFTGLIMLGLHSKTGTKDALLNHTYESDIKDIRINGVSVGEIGVEAAIGGDYGVPLILVTADSEGTKEASELIEGVVTVTVKESVDVTGALCYPIAMTRRMIYDAAKAVAQGQMDIKPYKVESPVKFEIDLFDTPYTERFKGLFGSIMQGNTVILEKSTANACWASYWKMKLEASSHEGEY